MEVTDQVSGWNSNKHILAKKTKPSVLVHGDQYLGHLTAPVISVWGKKQIKKISNTYNPHMLLNTGSPPFHNAQPQKK